MTAKELPSAIPWLQPALERFRGRLERGQQPQALLIHGPVGVGRRHFALTVAATLLGTEWRPDAGRPEEAVPHPDYWPVGLEEESRQIKVDQIRELIHHLGLTSHGGGRRVGLIHPAELLNHNAANTLLKTLEEPQPGTTLVLVATSPASLPATILSRCERVRLSPPSREAALAWLARQHPDRAACERALAFACGAPLLALALLAEGSGAGTVRLLGELGAEVQDLIDRRATPVAVAKAWAKRDAAVCLRWLQLQVMELLRARATHGSPTGGISPLKIPATAVNMAACCAYLDQLGEAQRLKDRGLNMEAQFADLLMWWYGAAGAAR